MARSLSEMLSLKSDGLSRRTVVLLTLAIFALGVALRLVWLWRIGFAEDDLQWQGTPLLTSPDGYWFASGAGELLTGGWGRNPRLPLPLDHALVALAWLAVKVTPWSLDQVILYLPALLGPLCALPLVLLGRALSLTRVGLVAGLALVVAPAWYSRTAAGYFDTDPLALFGPLIAVYYLVRLFGRATERLPRDGLFAAGWLAIYPWLYQPGALLGLALALTAAIGIALAHRRAPWAWPVLVMLAASQVPVHAFVRVALLAGAYLLLRWGIARGVRVPRSVAIGALAAFAIAAIALVGPYILVKIDYYLSGSGEAGVQGTVVFGDTGTHITELSRRSLIDQAGRVVGAWPLSVVALLGLVALVWRYPSLLLLAPLAALGAFSAIGGSRFIIYAVPLAALGIGFALAWIGDRLRGRFAWTFVPLASIAVLAPAVARDWVMFARPPIVRGEVEALDALKQRADPGATTIAWWDDGYAVTYFARTRTLIDGGMRETDAGLVAEILLSRPRAAANLARLTLTTRDAVKARWAIAPMLFEDARSGGLDLAALRERLASPDYTPPLPPSGEAAPIYLYLPMRLIGIAEVIAELRPRVSGEVAAHPYYRFASNVKVDGTRIDVGGAIVDADAHVVLERGMSRPLRTIFSVRGAGPTLEVRSKTKHPGAPTSGIYLHDPGLFIELDDEMLSSALIQLLVFERADPALFEPVYGNGAARVFRVLR